MEATRKWIYRVCLIVFLLLIQTAFANEAPFGAFLSPADNSTVSGNILVSGWALDDGGVESVKIYRDPLAGEGSELIIIADAVFIEGAQPDIAALYSNYPNSTAAGWGYMLLTNTLPNDGNGSFALHAVATDNQGNSTTLGSKTIIVDNVNNVKPIGDIETPLLGGITAGDSYQITGWALTPQPNHIPTDGSTIRVYIDGEYVGMPCYNMYREDIATLFPGWANSDGAVFYFWLDTTFYPDGPHTLHAVVTDNAGNSATIGQRIFQIDNEPVSVHPSISITVDDQPEMAIMENAYPNPFNPTTHISYSLKKRALVDVSVFDTLGRPVKTIYNGTQSAGTYRIFWNGRNNAGEMVPSGTYLIQMVTGENLQVQKVLLMK